MAGPQDRPAGLKTEDGGLETELQLARVIGTVVATQKHQAFTGAKLLLVQPVGLDDTPRGTALLAVDSVGAGVHEKVLICLLYTSDAADERSSVDLGGRRIIKK